MMMKSKTMFIDFLSRSLAQQSYYTFENKKPCWWLGGQPERRHGNEKNEAI